MRYFYDCEFIEDGATITLVSIGVVDENGREFYAVSTEFDPNRAIDWVRRHVLNQLPAPADPAWRSRARIRDDLLGTCSSPASRSSCGPGWPATTTSRWPSYGATCGRCRARSRDSPTSCASSGRGRLPAAAGCRPDAHDALADARHNLARWKVIEGRWPRPDREPWAIQLDQRCRERRQILLHSSKGLLRCVSEC